MKLLGATLMGEGTSDMRVISAVTMTKQLQNQFIDEANVMTAIRHPVSACVVILFQFQLFSFQNVILFMGACASPPAILMGYTKYGSLYDVLHNEGITTISPMRK